MTTKTFGIDYTCANCFFSVVTRANVTDIEGTVMCKWGPPAVALVPTGKQTANVQCFPRPMQKNDWCFQYRPKQEAIKAPNTAIDTKN